MSKKSYIMAALIVFLTLIIVPGYLIAQSRESNKELDEKVTSFLEKRKGTWRDLNVPESDGKILHDLIVNNKYKKALEIGTSTGHSGIWIAWALSKTGGKLITIEIDKSRHLQAVTNFKEAGLSDYVDARLADAHALVKKLPGPFDFVFCDADKEWYKQYFIDVYPKLDAGGCYTAHNVSLQGWSMGSGTKQFYDYMKGLSYMETSIDESGNGLSISYNRR